MDYNASICQHTTTLDDNLNMDTYECTNVYGFRDMDHAFLVARCSPSWNESFIESQCTSKSNSMHVYDTHGVNYYNIFCAICNFIHPRQTYIWGLHADNTCDEMKYRGAKIRQCWSFEECPDVFYDKAIRENCKSYLYPLSCAGHGNFKNPYCRLCRSYNPDTMTYHMPTCLSDMILTEGFGGTGSQGLQHIWQYRPDVKIETSETLSCSVGEVLDRANQICRSIVCSYGYVLQDSKCILKNGTYTSSDILYSGLCSRYAAMITLRGPVWSSLCLQNRIHDSSEMHPKRFEQLASYDIYDHYIGLIYEDVNNISDFIVIVENAIVESNSCSIEALELVAYCIGSTNVSLDCRGKWYALSPSQIHPANIPNYKHMFFQEGKYVLPDQLMVFLNFGSRDNMNDKLEIVFFCGNEIDLPSLDCEMISFESDEYLVNSSGLVLTQLGSVIPNDSFLLSLQSAHVCVDSISNKLTKTVPTQYYFFYGALDAVSFGFTCLSLVGEIATFTVYCNFKQLRNAYGKSIATLCFALFLAQTFTILADKMPLAPRACVAVAVATHYTWVSVFVWTSILAVILADTFAFRPMRTSSTSGKLLKYQLVGWLTPVPIVAVTTVLHFYLPNGVYGGDSVCWIVNPMTNLFVFGIPVALAICTNMVLLVITFVAIGSQRRTSMRLQNKKAAESGWKEITVLFKVYI